MHVHIKHVPEVSDNHLLMYGHWTITHMLGAQQHKPENPVLLNKARHMTRNDTRRSLLGNFSHFITSFSLFAECRRHKETSTNQSEDVQAGNKQ